MSTQTVTPFPVGPVPDDSPRLADRGGYQPGETRLDLQVTFTEGNYYDGIGTDAQGHTWRFERADCGAGCRCACTAHLLDGGRK